MLKHIENFTFQGAAYPEYIGERHALYKADTEAEAQKFYNWCKENNIARSVFMSGGEYFITKLIGKGESI